ncbi:hypothetical protein GO730_26580 [Spirosoma sp. HMF3257]|uniref:Uncharacterized protein n=1 Tax=Spirosoma telluris TaxID=2183553 RepID=A0A327NNP0_9BACT|nr:hypothetical protein [Spirosoma telluris]RAI76837.1 hypothetical protein HMF3257_26510 [Spirosoma telluris]
MQTIAMVSSKNIYLLKEYIKTFLATEIVFPGILPRQWGTDFTCSELDAIYFALKFVIRKAHPLQDRSMILAFEEMEEFDDLNLHWFLSDHWRELVIILNLYPNLGDTYLASLN